MYYLFKVERCDAINLLSKHETFEDALAAMKESLVKKSKKPKAFLSRQATSRRKTRINIRSNSMPTLPSRLTMKKARLLRLQITAMTALPNGLSSM